MKTSAWKADSSRAAEIAPGLSLENQTHQLLPSTPGFGTHTGFWLQLFAYLPVSKGNEMSGPREWGRFQEQNKADWNKRSQMCGAATEGEGGWGGGRGKLETPSSSPKMILSWWLAMLSSSLERLANVQAHVWDEPTVCSLGRRRWRRRGLVGCLSVCPHRERWSSTLVAWAGHPAAAHKFCVPLTRQSPPNHWTKKPSTQIHKLSLSAVWWSQPSQWALGRLPSHQSLAQTSLGLLQAASPSSGPAGESPVHRHTRALVEQPVLLKRSDAISLIKQSWGLDCRGYERFLSPKSRAVSQSCLLIKYQCDWGHITP